MKQKANEVYKNLFLNNKRYYILMGGRSAGRSYVASQFVSSHLISPLYFRCGAMRYILSDVRTSIFQEVLDRFDEQEVNDPNLIIRDLEIDYLSNSVKGLGFRKSSGDQKAKLKSLANYTCIVIEEADEIDEDSFLKLDDTLRTKKADIKIILLLNPPDKNHWIIKKWFNLVDCGVEGFYKAELKESEKHNTEFIFTTFRDNQKNLNKTTIENFLRYKETRPDHYWNMIEGLVPSGKRGVIFKTWQPMTVKEYDDLPYNVFYGQDFGFTNDPATLIEIKMHNDNIYLRRIVYEVGLLNKSLSDKMKQLGISTSKEIIADSAEPKSIAEMKSYGWHILPADKGADSVRSGVNLLLGKNIYYTEDSTEIATEIQNYTWALDKNKEPTNEPIDDWNHCIDAIRYAVTYQLSKKTPNIRSL
jgi:phage terminase large subunit